MRAMSGMVPWVEEEKRRRDKKGVLYKRPRPLKATSAKERA